jgi:hypothetical protein
MAARTNLIILIGAAYLGGAVTLHLCWQHSVFLAVVAAPFGGSLAVLSAAVLLYLRDPDERSRPAGPGQRRLSGLLGRIG